MTGSDKDVTLRILFDKEVTLYILFNSWLHSMVIMPWSWIQCAAASASSSSSLLYFLLLLLIFLLPIASSLIVTGTSSTYNTRTTVISIDSSRKIQTIKSWGRRRIQPEAAGVKNIRSHITSFLSSAPSTTTQQQDSPGIMSNKTPVYDWCCTAAIQPQNVGTDSSTDATTTDTTPTTSSRRYATSNDVIIQKIAGYYDEQIDQSDSWLKEIDGRLLDITESPGWMEYVERLEKRLNDEGGAGAYDTLRCDMILKDDDVDGDEQHESLCTDNKNKIDRWRNWGLDYHLNRLQNSYRSLLMSENETEDNIKAGTTNSNHDEAIKEAVTESHLVFERLLSQAERSPLLNRREDNRAPSSHKKNDVTIQLIRLTLLWSPPSTSLKKEDASSCSNKVIVRGHACSSAKAVQVHRPVVPITASVAAVGHHRHNKTSSSNIIEVDQSLPTRFLDPQNKIASWTRIRKQMEVPIYKPPGVSEVLMVRPSTRYNSKHVNNSNEKNKLAAPSQSHPSDTGLEVLEGLSSNFFVVYKDGTIRTAQDGVLLGYVRQLVLDSLDSCDLKLDTTNPVLLQDGRDGLWEEAFITSSSRLIFPISKMLVHTDDGINFEEYWCDPALSSNTTKGDLKLGKNDPANERPKWQALLDEILRKGGYPPLEEQV